MKFCFRQGTQKPLELRSSDECSSTQLNTLELTSCEKIEECRAPDAKSLSGIGRGIADVRGLPLHANNSFLGTVRPVERLNTRHRPRRSELSQIGQRFMRVDISNYSRDVE